MPVILSATPSLALSGGTVTGNITVNGHIQFGASAPSCSPSSGAGTSPPSPVVTTGSNDCGGTITWGTGTLPSNAAQLAVTFAVPWVIPGGGGPHVNVTPINAATQALGLYVSGISPTGFTVNVATAPAASQGASVYQFCYSAAG